MSTRPDSRRRAWRFALLAFVLASALGLVGAPRPADAGGRKSNAKWDDGSRAPVDAWTQEDGCPARTGATESEFRDGPREVAWRFNVSGEVEGEPLAWGGRTFVLEKSGARRTLHVLLTSTGVEKAKQSFDGTLSSGACVYDGRVVLRTSPRTVQGFTVGETSLSSRWTLTAKNAIGPPTVVREEVYVVVDGVLQARLFGSPQPVWPKAGGAEPVRVDGTPAGKGAPVEYPRPSVRGESVFVASGRRLVEVDRRSGALRRKADLDLDADPRLTRVLVGSADVLVTIGRRDANASPETNTCRFGRSDGGELTKRETASFPYGLASIGASWVGVLVRGSEPPALVRFSGLDEEVQRSFELATPAMHPEFLEAKVPPAASGNVVYLGGRVFDSVALGVLRAETVACVSRTVPLRDRLLVVEAKNRVTAWKSARKGAEVPPLRLLPADADGAATLALPAGRASLEDGRVVTGGFAWDKKATTLRGTGKPGDAGAWPAAAVRALLTDETPRRLILASRPEEAANGVAAIARAGTSPDLVALIPKAIEAHDATLARRVLTAAAERGASEADLVIADRDVAALEAAGGEPVDEKVSDVEEKLKALLAREVDALVEAAALPKDVPFAYSLALVRAAIDRSPYHGGATEWIRSHLPSGVVVPVIKNPADWLDFFEIQANTAMHVYAPGGPGVDDTTLEVAPHNVGEALAAARSTWRPEVVGFQNGPLLVVAPPDVPGMIARSLTIGRLVCDALDAAFASIGPPRAEDQVLMLHLFPSRGEYLAQSREGKDEEPGHESGLESTAGHYDPSANVTRIFVPGLDIHDSVPGTYAHELTHHWISVRRPARANGDSDGLGSGSAGYFVVEGFADFVRGFAFDAVAVKADPRNPRAEYANVVAGVPDAEAVPWPKIFSMTQREAYALIDAPGKSDIPSHWEMGPGHKHSPGLLYYAQAAAATGYLFLADDGKYRPTLLAYVYDYYAGRGDPKALLATLGVTAEELGARIVKWCRAMVTAPK